MPGPFCANDGGAVGVGVAVRVGVAVVGGGVVVGVALADGSTLVAGSAFDMTRYPLTPAPASNATPSSNTNTARPDPCDRRRCGTATDYGMAGPAYLTPSRYGHA